MLTCSVSGELHFWPNALHEGDKYVQFIMKISKGDTVSYLGNCEVKQNLSLFKKQKAKEKRLKNIWNFNVILCILLFMNKIY